MVRGLTTTRIEIGKRKGRDGSWVATLVTRITKLLRLTHTSSFQAQEHSTPKGMTKGVDDIPYFYIG
jgi:hypothetical protein